METETRWKIDDSYTCRATTPEGKHVVFDDLLFEGEEVGLGEVPENAQDREGRPPYGRVVRDADGLWVVPNTPKQEHQRLGEILESSR